MVGFGSLGGLGGRPGGFGASYPTRGGAPNSQAVGYVPDQQAWETDWKRRWEEASRGPTSSGGGPRPDTPTGDANWSDSSGISSSWGNGGSPIEWAQANRSAYNQDAPIPTMGWSFQTGVDPNYSADAPTAVWGPQFERNGYQAAAGDVPYVPDFTALNAERESMQPLFENRERQQQAYNSMLGNGQINGIISPEYTNPNFGQIGAQTPEVPEGTNMEWAADVYRPGDTFTAPRPTSKGWNFW